MISLLTTNTTDDRPGWLAKTLSLTPLVFVSLISLTLVSMVIYSGLHQPAARYLSLEHASGLLSDILWWQVLVNEILSSLVYVVAELVFAVLLIRLVKDTLPLAALRFTLLLSIWLIPQGASEAVIQQHIQLLVPAPHQWLIPVIEPFSHMWYYASMTAVILFIFWQNHDQENYLIDRIYRPGIYKRLQRMITTPKSGILLPALVLLSIHFNPMAEWTRLQQELNPAFHYTDYLDLASILSFFIEILLLTFIATCLRKLL